MRISGITPGPDQQAGSPEDLKFILSDSITDVINDVNIRVISDNEFVWIASEIDGLVISIVVINKHKSGYWQLYKTWTNSKLRGNNRSGDLIELLIKKYNYSPLLIDNIMSPSAIGRIHKLFSSNKVSVSIWDIENNLKIPYTTSVPVYRDLFKQLKSNIPNKGSIDGDQYVWLMENWKNTIHKNYLGEGMLSRRTEYFM